jgi:enediyne biosynthesis protein E4
MYVANGHIDPEIERVAQRVHYAEPPHLFRNLDGRRFEDVASAMGKSFDAPRVARGAAYGDINNDGALDIVITTNGGSATLFLNRGVTNNGLRIKLVGTKSNRDGIGSEVTVVAGKDKQTRTLSSGSSYLSSSELVLTFGLASHKQADSIEIRWPSGQVDHLSNVAANQIVTVKEGKGIVAAKPFEKR